MIEVQVSGVRDGVGRGAGVVFVFDYTASDADLALVDEAIKRLGGDARRANMVDRDPDQSKSEGGGARADDG